MNEYLLENCKEGGVVDIISKRIHEIKMLDLTKDLKTFHKNSKRQYWIKTYDNDIAEFMFVTHGKINCDNNELDYNRCYIQRRSSRIYKHWFHKKGDRYDTIKYRERYYDEKLNGIVNIVKEKKHNRTEYPYINKKYLDNIEVAPEPIIIDPNPCVMLGTRLNRSMFRRNRTGMNRCLLEVMMIRNDLELYPEHPDLYPLTYKLNPVPIIDDVEFWQRVRVLRAERVARE